MADSLLWLMSTQRLDRINDILRQVFLLLPHFCLGRGLIDMTRNQLMSDVFRSYGVFIYCLHVIECSKLNANRLKVVKVKSSPSHMGPLGGADLCFISPQTDTS